MVNVDDAVAINVGERRAACGDDALRGARVIGLTTTAVAKRREDPAPYKVQITHVFGAKEEKADEDERTALVRN